jgi:hypothetical protein
MFGKWRSKEVDHNRADKVDESLPLRGKQAAAI